MKKHNEGHCMPNDAKCASKKEHCGPNKASCAPENKEKQHNGNSHSRDENRDKKDRW